MKPPSGFYALLDPCGRLARDAFDAAATPRPLCPGAWGDAWSSAGHEAAIETAGGRTLAFHGIVHNRPALAEALGVPADISTAALLLRAWAAWPSDWAERIDGLYALAHWTGQGEDLMLRRDASGALGLFYARTADGTLAVSSHLDTLLRLPGMRRRLARRGLHEYLRLLDIAAPNTIYEGVRAVPAGEGVRLDARRTEIEIPLPPPAPAAVEVTFDDAVAQLESCLQASIARRLAGAERPAAFLSGGVDSALICALAAHLRPGLPTLTVGFEGEAFDETPVARAVATHLGLPQRTLRFGRADLLDALARAGGDAEQPMADPAEPATLLAFEAARHEHDVVLDGTGADEAVGALPPRHARVAAAWTSRLPLPLRRTLAATLPRLPGLAGYAPLFDFEHPAEVLMRWRGFRRQEIEALCGEPVSLAHLRFIETFERFPRGDHFARSRALMDAMPSDRLSQAALATGLDVRFPFCDPQVEAWLRGQPQAHNWQAGEPKRILRALLAQHVPRPLWDLPKHSFDFPLPDFLRTDDCQVVRRYLLHARWADWHALDPDRVADYAHRFIAGEPDLHFRIWALVVLAAWLEGHAD